MKDAQYGQYADQNKRHTNSALGGKMGQSFEYENRNMVQQYEPLQGSQQYVSHVEPSLQHPQYHDQYNSSRHFNTHQ